MRLTAYSIDLPNEKTSAGDHLTGSPEQGPNHSKTASQGWSLEWPTHDQRKEPETLLPGLTQQRAKLAQTANQPGHLPDQTGAFSLDSLGFHRKSGWRVHRGLEGQGSPNPFEDKLCRPWDQNLRAEIHQQS
ncbi:MAG: hypothetical protein ABGX16_04750 [Pirellulales bacterium]